jgi:nicotinate-nucleotide adenylyltransferase
MKIALFGGSFNPPHLGHIAVAKELAESSLFDEVWIIPVLKHPFHKELLSFEDRVKMCRLAFTPLSKKIKVSEVEKEINSPQGYTLDLIDHLLKKYPDTSFSLAIGTDLLQESKKWKNFGEIEKKISLFKIPRSGYEKSHYPSVSSSEARKAIARGYNLKKLLSQEIINFIQQKGFYQ